MKPLITHTAPVGKARDLTDQTFGRLTVLHRVTRTDREGTFWKCQCSCGNISPAVSASSLLNGTSQSCGCLHLELMRKPDHVVKSQRNPAYSAYQCMKTRCLNSNHPSYKHYGAKGVTICPEWLESYDNFIRDLGPMPPGFSLDRINPHGSYCKENCRWADDLTQGNNKRRHLQFQHNGTTKSLTQICREENVNFLCVRQQVVSFGLTLEEAIDCIRKSGNPFFERAKALGGAGPDARKTPHRRQRNTKSPNSVS